MVPVDFLCGLGFLVQVALGVSDLELLGQQEVLEFQEFVLVLLHHTQQPLLLLW